MLLDKKTPAVSLLLFLLEEATPAAPWCLLLDEILPAGRLWLLLEKGYTGISLVIAVGRSHLGDCCWKKLQWQLPGDCCGVDSSVVVVGRSYTGSP